MKIIKLLKERWNKWKVVKDFCIYEVKVVDGMRFITFNPSYSIPSRFEVERFL